jgi:hypothetical protein
MRLIDSVEATHLSLQNSKIGQLQDRISAAIQEACYAGKFNITVELDVSDRDYKNILCKTLKKNGYRTDSNNNTANNNTITIEWGV